MKTNWEIAAVGKLYGDKVDEVDGDADALIPDRSEFRATHFS